MKNITAVLCRLAAVAIAAASVLVPSHAAQSDAKRFKASDFKFSSLPMMKAKSGTIYWFLYTNPKLDRATVERYLSSISGAKVNNSSGRTIPPGRWRFATDSEADNFMKQFRSQRSAFEKSDPNASSKMTRYVVAYESGSANN